MSKNKHHHVLSYPMSIKLDAALKTVYDVGSNVLLAQALPGVTVHRPVFHKPEPVGGQFTVGRGHH
jgi:hypothetical protein